MNRADGMEVPFDEKPSYTCDSNKQTVSCRNCNLQFNVRNQLSFEKNDNFRHASSYRRTCISNIGLIDQ